MTLGLEVAGSGRFDDGVEVIADFALDLRQNGAAPDDLSLRDGSGLSAANLVTPAAVVRVLAYAARQPWGARLLEAMAGPGQGTLRAWPRLPPVAAKTGTLRHTVALTGILDPGSETRWSSATSSITTRGGPPRDARSPPRSGRGAPGNAPAAARSPSLAVERRTRPDRASHRRSRRGTVRARIRTVFGPPSPAVSPPIGGRRGVW